MLRAQIANRYILVKATLVQSDRIQCSLAFGVCLDERNTAEGIPTFGIQWTPLGSIPFAMSSTGEIDFGVAYDLQQYGQTDFLTKQIEVGCRFSWEAHGENDIYEIVKIIVPHTVADNVAGVGLDGLL